MDHLTETVALLPHMVEAARVELVRAREDAHDLTQRVASLTTDLARARADAATAIQDLNVRITSLTTDLARAQTDARTAIQDLNARNAGLTTDLARSHADADSKEDVIKELTGIIVEKDHRIADLMTSKTRKPWWWRRIMPKGM